MRPVADAHVDPIKPFVARQVWAMVQLQRLTGMRPGEVVNMRGCDLDTARPLWEYRPAGHKTEHLERERIIPLGPHAQKVIKPFLRTDTTAYMFSPADADAERREELHQRRKTKVQPSQTRRHLRALQRMEHGLRGRTPKDRYTVDSYRRAIARACEHAFPPPEPLGRYPKETIAAWRNRLTPEQQQALRAWRRTHSWYPHQLRHSAATKIRKELGLEAVQVCLGHARADVTQIYAERNLELAREIARRLG